MYEKTTDIEKYTIALYREKYGCPSPIGSGILICYNYSFYLISAFHVFDMEDERLAIENDPDEEGIPHDDMEGIYAQGVFDNETCYFYVNENATGIVFTTSYDEKNGKFTFNEDAEFIVCEINDNLAQCFIDGGKIFYSVDDLVHKDLNPYEEVILAGYPGYAQSGKEVYRSYEGFWESVNSNNGLFRVSLNFKNAYCYELGIVRGIRRKPGLEGMSGGGIWYNNDGLFYPIGIMIKQYPNKNIVEGYSFASILEFIKNWFNHNS